jgi:hypothetical protein
MRTLTTGSVSDQLHLLRELASSGGELIVRHHRGRAEYEALERAGLITALAISKDETRYKITISGRRRLVE